MIPIYVGTGRVRECGNYRHPDNLKLYERFVANMLSSKITMGPRFFVYLVLMLYQEKHLKKEKRIIYDRQILRKGLWQDTKRMRMKALGKRKATEGLHNMCMNDVVGQ